MGRFFTHIALRFITALVATTALLGCFGCDAPPYPTQPSPQNAPAAKWASTPRGVFVASHQGQEVFRIEAKKWRDGHRAAVAITHDAPWGIDPVFSLATNAVIARGLRMDIEVVSDKLQHPSRFPIVARMHRELLPNGVHVYGHGHTHIDHDAISYHDAFRSFRTNFELMRTWGFNPKVYARHRRPTAPPVLSPRAAAPATATPTISAPTIRASPRAGTICPLSLWAPTRPPISAHTPN
jgi:hypothetical protein